MSGSKIKNIAIAVLVLINAFFLAIIIIDNYADATEERQALENVCEVLQSNGILIDTGNIKTAGAFSAMRTVRGEDMEAAIASVFLGNAEMTDQGVIYLYENVSTGSAEFASAGDFVIRLNEGVITNTDGTLKTVEGLLRDAQLETSDAVIQAGQENETVTVFSAYKKANIFNCIIHFTFIEGSLRTVSGRYVAGIEPVEDGAEISYVGTALLGFLAAVKRGDLECAEIQSVEAGYVHSAVGPFGEGVITPVWLIDTDNGRYVVDSASGEIRMI